MARLVLQATTSSLHLRDLELREMLTTVTLQSSPIFEGIHAGIAVN